jgi:hypothetical protein
MRGSFFSSANLRDEPRDALHVAGLSNYRPFFTQVFTPRELFAGPFA